VNRPALRRVWRAAWWPLGIAIGVGLSWLLLREIDLGDVGARLAGADPGWVLLAIVSVTATLIAKTLRWRSLFQRHSQIPLFDLAGALLVGQLVNTAVPVRMGEVARASTLSGARPATSYTFSTIVAEKLVDGVILGLLALVTIGLAPLPEAIRRSAVVIVGVSLVVLLVWLAFAVARGDRLLARLENGRLNWVARHGREPVVVIRRLLRGGVLLRIVAWSLVALGLGALTNYACLEALSLHPDWSASLAVLVIGQFGGAVPTAPGRIGVFQGLCVAALAPYAVAREPAISFGILLYVVAIVLPCLAGFAYLLALRRRNRVLAAARPEIPDRAQ
jgi:uncharacterized membrane protein YbhN (UPF0104 family)